MAKTSDQIKVVAAIVLIAGVIAGCDQNEDQPAASGIDQQGQELRKKKHHDAAVPVVADASPVTPATPDAGIPYVFDAASPVDAAPPLNMCPGPQNLPPFKWIGLVNGARAMIKGTGSNPLSGQVDFTPLGYGKVQLTVYLSNAPPGVHAIHIHDMADCAMMGNCAGGHWNPTNKMHGKLGVGEFHLGDIGNITVGADGTGFLLLTVQDLWTVYPGPNNVVGHAIMVHANADDFVTQPTGNAGARIGCGAIQQCLGCSGHW